MESWRHDASSAVPESRPLSPLLLTKLLTSGAVASTRRKPSSSGVLGQRDVRRRTVRPRLSCPGTRWQPASSNPRNAGRADGGPRTTRARPGRRATACRSSGDGQAPRGRARLPSLRTSGRCGAHAVAHDTPRDTHGAAAHALRTYSQRAHDVLSMYSSGGRLAPDPKADGCPRRVATRRPVKPPLRYAHT